MPITLQELPVDDILATIMPPGRPHEEEPDAEQPDDEEEEDPK